MLFTNFARLGPEMSAQDKVYQAIQSWQGDQTVKKFILSACSKSETVEQFLSNQKYKQLIEKFCKKKKPKFARDSLEEALNYLQGSPGVRQSKQPLSCRASVDSGYDSVVSERSRDCRSRSSISASLANRPLPPTPTDSQASATSMSVEAPQQQQPRSKPAVEGYPASASSVADSVQGEDSVSSTRTGASTDSAESAHSTARASQYGRLSAGDRVQPPQPRPRLSLARRSTDSNPLALAVPETRAENGPGAAWAEAERPGTADGESEEASPSPMKQVGYFNISGARNEVSVDLEALKLMSYFRQN